MEGRDRERDLGNESSEVRNKSKEEELKWAKREFKEKKVKNWKGRVSKV